ncbi:MAG: TorD/DmsD family molecular chaperone [Acidimicrobiales bacterium]
MRSPKCSLDADMGVDEVEPVSELLSALAYLCDTPRPARSVTEALGMAPVEAYEHTELFLLQLAPYASVYLSCDAMLGGEIAGRIAGMWSTLGFAVPSEPDHLSGLLSLLAKLEEETSDARLSERYREALQRTKGVVFWEYLAPWVPMYARKMSELAEGTGYQRWGELLVACLDELALRYCDVGSVPSWEFPEASSDMSVDAVEELRVLVIPAISGTIVSRRDLLRCGTETGLGARVGERWFMLRTMLEADRELVLSWMLRYIEAELGELAGLQERSGSGIFDVSRERLERTYHYLEARARSAVTAE